MEAVDAKDLIEEAIERTEEKIENVENAQRERDRKFRDRVSLMVGGCAVALAIVHMSAAGAQRQSVLKQIEASDSFAYMQAKIIREAVFKTAAASSGASEGDKRAWLDEVTRLQVSSDSGRGIGQLQEQGTKQHEEGLKASNMGEAYELGETGLQLAIVLLSIALIARSTWIAVTASLFAFSGIALAVATHFGIAIFQ